MTDREHEVLKAQFELVKLSLGDLEGKLASVGLPLEKAYLFQKDLIASLNNAICAAKRLNRRLQQMKLTMYPDNTPED